MLNTDGQYRLVFCTTAEVQLQPLANALRDERFIGNVIFPNSCTEFCAGDSFLSSITFMGCSPYIEFEPPADLQPDAIAEFCFIRMSKTRLQRVMYHAYQLEKLKTIPRCQRCRKVIEDWQQQIKPFNSSKQLNCTNCKALLTADELDWRKASGIGNIFIEVMNVFLQEAVPTDAFIQQLESLTASKWNYFYTDTNIETKLLDRT